MVLAPPRACLWVPYYVLAALLCGVHTPADGEDQMSRRGGAQSPGCRPIGTIDWAELRGGRLGLVDRLHLCAQTVLEVGRLPVEIWDRIVGYRYLPKVPLTTPRCPPASTIVASAKAACQSASIGHPWLYPHCKRTFLFSQLFAEAMDVPFDLELLWVAAMTHDLGMVDTPAAHAAPCFAVRSASAAKGLAAQAGWPLDRQRRLATAVSIHINTRVTQQTSPEGLLLSAGSALDVAGLRLRRVYSDEFLEILPSRTAREAFLATITCSWRTESMRHPGCRVGFLRFTGLPVLISSSPLPKL